MNTITEQDRKIAETLKSLALEPRPQPEKPPRKRTRRLLLGVCLLAAGAGIVFSRQQTWPELLTGSKAVPPVDGDSRTQAQAEISSGSDGTNVTPKTPAKITAASREIAGSGYVTAPKTVAVFAKYEGFVTAVNVAIGDEVKAGQILLRLDDENARLAHERALAAKVSAVLALDARLVENDHAEALQKRAEALAARQITSLQEVEKVRATARTAAIAVSQARQEIARADLDVQIARERVDALVITAPMDGTVTRLDAHVGDTVLARVDSVRESQSLLTLIDMNALVIDADVAETNIAALRKGQRGEAVLDGFPDQPFGIEIKRLAPVASAEKGTISLNLVFTDPPLGIRPNMAARIRISVSPTIDTEGISQ